MFSSGLLALFLISTAFGTVKRFSEKYEKAMSGIHGHKKNSMENPNPMQLNLITTNLQKMIHIFNRNDIISKKNPKNIENNF